MEVAADLAVFSDPVLAVVVDLVPPRVRAVLLPELDGSGEVLLVVVVVVVLDLVGAVVIPEERLRVRVEVEISAVEDV